MSATTKEAKNISAFCIVKVMPKSVEIIWNMADFWENNNFSISQFLSDLGYHPRGWQVYGLEYENKNVFCVIKKEKK